MASKLDDATVAKIEAPVRKTMTENKIPDYALGAAKDGKIANIKGFGVERVGVNSPVTPHTVFGRGSVNKAPLTHFGTRDSGLGI